MLKCLIFQVAMLFVCRLSFCQTPTLSQFEQVVRSYNILQSYIQETDPTRLTAEQIERLRADIRMGIALTSSLLNAETGESAALARYFNTMFRLEEARLYANTGEPSKSLAVLEDVRRDVESFTEAFFPRTYEAEGKTYTIGWSNFAPTRAGYFGLLAEQYFREKNYSKALEEARRAFGHPFISNRDRIGAAYYALQSKTQLQQLDTERIDFALQALRAFDRLSSDESAVFLNEKNNLPGELFRAVHEALQAGPATYAEAGRYYGEMAPLLAPYDAVRDEAIVAYTEALKRNYGAKAFAERAYVFAARYYQQPWANQRANRNPVLTQLALQALHVLQQLQRSDDCEGLGGLADRYKKFGDTAGAEHHRRLAEACTATQKKLQRKAQRESHFYAGAYLIPLIQFENNRRDYGLAINFGNRRTLIELSYQYINNNEERYTDLRLRGIGTKNIPSHRWSGYYAHLAIKFANPRRSGPRLKLYKGALLGYNVRNFGAIQAMVLVNPMEQPSNQVFNPVQKQFFIMYNGGMLSLRGYSFDVYYSLGAAYSRFDPGNTEFARENVFLIFDGLLHNRKREYIGLIGRLGMTVGFGR